MPWKLFQNPTPLSSQTLLWLILPLCAVVAVVYKTVRTRSLRRLPREILSAMALLAGGIVLLAIGLWLIQTLAA